MLKLIRKAEGVLSEALLERKISQSFEYGFGDIPVVKVKELIKEFQKYKNLKITKFDIGNTGKSNFFIQLNKEVPGDFKVKDCFITVVEYSKEKASIDFYANSLEELEYISKIVNPFVEEDDEIMVEMHNYVLENSLSFDSITIAKKDIKKILPDFYPDFISTDEFFNQFVQAKENILVISGSSGIGKTKFTTLFLKYMLDHPELFDLDSDEGFEEDIKVAYVKNETILSLDSFWLNLRSYQYNLVILDDLDHYLSPRIKNVNSSIDDKKNQFISNLLSFTDGILPTKTKFMITTNRDIQNIDEALMRDGRMFGVFCFSKLSNEEALTIWKKHELSEETFLEEFGEENEILQARLGSLIDRYLKNNKKKRNPFLKPGSKADITSKYQDSSKKMGF